jgi:MSHA biogenesis protein MshP
MFRRRGKTKGFGVPLALFVIVAAAVLAAAITMLAGTQQASSAIDTLGVQSYQAARAGLEWGIHHALRIGDCAAVHNGGVGTTFSPGIPAAVRVTVRCTSSPHTEAGVAFTMYEVTATACTVAAACPGGVPTSLGYVERELRVIVGSN